MNSFLLLLKREMTDIFISKKVFMMYVILFLFSILVFLASLARIVNVPIYLTYMVTGYIFVSYVNFSLPTGLNVLIEQNNGHLRYVSSFPINYYVYGVTKILGGALSGCLGLTIFLVLINLLPGMFLHNITLGFREIVDVYFLGLLFGIFISSFSIILVSFNSFNDSRYRLLYYVVQTCTLFLSPAFYSLSELPVVMRLIAYVNPLTWVIILFRNNFSILSTFTPITLMQSGMLYLILIITATITFITGIKKMNHIIMSSM